jgi:hypothetical protein
MEQNTWPLTGHVKKELINMATLHKTGTGYEILTEEQRAAAESGSVEKRMLSLGCPAHLARKAQETRNRVLDTPRSAKPNASDPFVARQLKRLKALDDALYGVGDDLRRKRCEEIARTIAQDRG